MVTNTIECVIKVNGRPACVALLDAKAFKFRLGDAAPPIVTYPHEMPAPGRTVENGIAIVDPRGHAVIFIDHAAITFWEGRDVEVFDPLCMSDRTQVEIVRQVVNAAPGACAGVLLTILDKVAPRRGACVEVVDDAGGVASTPGVEVDRVEVDRLSFVDRRHVERIRRDLGNDDPPDLFLLMQVVDKAAPRPGGPH